MNPKYLQQMAFDICNRFNYPLPKSLILTRKFRTSLGKTICNAKKIELNEWFVLNNKKKIVEALLKHEICHFRHCNHQKEFDQAVRIMGSAIYIEDLFDDIVYPTKYVYKCPKCNIVICTNKKLTAERSCRECGGRKFNKEFEFRLVQERV